MQWLYKIRWQFLVVAVLCVALVLVRAEVGAAQRSPFTLPSANLDQIARDISNRIQPEIEQVVQTAFTDTIQPPLDQFTRQITDYRNEINRYQAEVTALPDEVEAKVNAAVDGIAGQVQAQLTELSTSVEAAVTGSIRKVGWGILVGELLGSGAMTALVTWLIVRRVNQQLKTQLASLERTIAEITAAAQAATRDVAGVVPDVMEEP